MNSYEAKLERRRERLEARARNLKREGDARYARAHSMAEAIPFGQPILVGHHSEGRDRRYRAKIHNNFGKAFEALNAAKELEARAASVGTGGISSDDPEAVVKLKAELVELEATQARMKAANKIVRKFLKEPQNGMMALEQLGFTAGAAARLFEPDFCGRVGFPAYAISNHGANVRRVKGRIEELSRNANRETKEVLHNSGVRLVENAEENRVQLFFPGKPAEEIRARLKAHGFRWSPYAGAWQRHLNGNGVWAAKHILESLIPKEEKNAEPVS